LSFLCSVLRVSPDTDPSRRDRSVSVPAESAAETATVNHDCVSSPLSWYQSTPVFLVDNLVVWSLIWAFFEPLCSWRRKPCTRSLDQSRFSPDRQGTLI